MTDKDYFAVLLQNNLKDLKPVCVDFVNDTVNAEDFNSLSDEIKTFVFDRVLYRNEVQERFKDEYVNDYLSIYEHITINSVSDFQNFKEDCINCHDFNTLCVQFEPVCECLFLRHLLDNWEDLNLEPLSCADINSALNDCVGIANRNDRLLLSDLKDCLNKYRA